MALKLKWTMALALLLSTDSTMGQGIGVGTPFPVTSAALDVVSVDKGFFIPRLSTTQRQAITTTATEQALLVFDTDSNLFFYWNTTTWIPFPDIVDTDNQAFSISSDTIFIDNGNFAVLPKDDDWAYDGNDLHNLNTGNVGINKTDPTAKLSLQTDASGTAFVSASNASNQVLLYGRNDRKMGVNNSQPTVEIDVIGNELVYQITPRYLGPRTFIVPGTSATATFDTAFVWGRNQHLYIRFEMDDGLDWVEANEGARYLGGYLPTLTSEAESEFFKANLLRGRGAPIGFTDVKQEGKWEWITGEIGVTGQNDVFTDWEPLEPNNALGCAGEDVAVFYPSAIDTLQRWNDVHPETAPDHYCFPTIPLPDNDLIVEFGYIKSP